MTEGVRLTLFARSSCGLCEEAHEVVEQVCRELDSHVIAFEVVDITTDSRLMARFRYDIPVLAIDDKPAFRHRVDRDRLVARLVAGTPAPLEESAS